MATYKRIDGEYTIYSINPEDDVVIDTNTLRVLGNLDVSGNLTYINVTELNVKDPFIVLNSSNTGSYPSNSGVLTHTAVSTFAGIRYDATAGQWELSSATDSTGLTGTWTPIATGNASPGGANTEVQFNNGAGAFGGNANLTFNVASSRLTLDGAFVLVQTTNSPSSIASAATITSSNLSSGGTGIYFTNESVTDELISQAQAKKFALIF